MIVGLDHVGLSVPELDEEVAWFAALGFGEIERFGFDGDPAAARVAELDDVAVDAAMLRGGAGGVELFRFRRPDPFDPAVAAERGILGARAVTVTAAAAQDLMSPGVTTAPDGTTVLVDGRDGASARLDGVVVATARLERLVDFYATVLGLSVVDEGGPLAAPSWSRVIGTAVRRSATIGAGAAKVELVEVAAPPGPAREVPVFAAGINHVCFEVDDVDAAYRRLAGAVRFHCAPVELAPGLWLTYGRDPDGNVFELMRQEPTGSG